MMINLFKLNKTLCLLVLVGAFGFSSAQTKKLSAQFAESEMKRFPEAWQFDHGKRLYFGYTQGLGGMAMLKMWKQTNEQKYFDYVEKWADTIINDQGEIHMYKVESYNIDYINSGKVLFPLFEKTGKQKYKLAIERLMKQLEHHPRTHEGVYWHKLIYPHQIWLDGLYMGDPFVAAYGKFVGDDTYYDDVINQFIVTAKHTYDKKTGLYYHGWDESKNQRWANKQTGQSPNFWGRSNGWWFMALVDVLDFIPESYPKRDSLLQIINDLAETLPRYQDSDGLWSQVLDQPGRERNYQEASVSSMFMYSYAKAVNKGYIDKKYRAVAEKTLAGIQKKLLKTESDGTLTLIQCNAVSGLGGNPYRDGSYDYYVGERVRENDGKATGPFIMGLLELGK
ncbi:MAG: glycoside hydrolase family 88/105 protein [Sphingobacterium sp.]|uniref:glycoside hydrolase family 88/105 protein n=1 Tax=Sphingobacterium sp. JB170 TaxID=1434842 RepID=UPI00097ED771|nr:glycoside hydrolase family 88 protein [Sphingobacterium sp. JB170]SJN34238.1 Rhamnogalacturonides degradation protein RhiN [Sphingobacterium sp. JB170]